MWWFNPKSSAFFFQAAWRGGGGKRGPTVRFRMVRNSGLSFPGHDVQQGMDHIFLLFHHFLVFVAERPSWPLNKKDHRWQLLGLVIVFFRFSRISACVSDDFMGRYIGHCGHRWAPGPCPNGFKIWPEPALVQAGSATQQSLIYNLEDLRLFDSQEQPDQVDKVALVHDIFLLLAVTRD